MDSRVLRAVAPYGIGPVAHDGPPGGSGFGAVARELIEHMDCAPRKTGGVVLITGPSGAGKSSLLGVVRTELAASGCGVLDADRVRIPGDRPVAGLARRTPIRDWLGCLSRAGLADARTFATRAGELSVGETMRLRLALAFAKFESSPSNQPRWLLCDEFCSVLDRATSAGVASALHRWARAAGVRVVVASAHADLERLVGPDLIARVEPGGSVLLEESVGRVRAGRVVIERGTIDDYRALAVFHYRGNRPASVARVLRATVADPSSAKGRRVSGVLVISYPTLNGSWREMAWPGRYVVSPGERSRCARQLNREVRRLSRVVVDPRDRGRGIARRLVRAYLDDPITPATEAVSTMGRLSPFGRSAGMVEYALPPRPADDRLADMLDAMWIEPWELIDDARIEVVRASRDGVWLARELGVWSRAVRSSVPKPMRHAAEPFVYASLAAGRLCAPPVAYAHAV